MSRLISSNDISALTPSLPFSVYFCAPGRFRIFSTCPSCQKFTVHFRHAVFASCADIVLFLHQLSYCREKKREILRPSDMKPSSSTSSSKHRVHTPSDTVPHSHSARSRGSISRHIGVCLFILLLSPLSVLILFPTRGYERFTCLSTLSLQLQLSRGDRDDRFRRSKQLGMEF